MASQTFTSTDTWIAPAGVTSVQAECWGGGGWSGNVAAGEGGGGGGGYSKANAVVVTPGNSYTVTVGVGGSNGVAAGDSWFSTSGTVLAKGGATASGRNGGAGGVAASGIGDTKFSGGSGATSVGLAPASGGGGGGGSAGTAIDGNDGSGNVTTTGGAGGVAVTDGGVGGDGGDNTLNGHSPASGAGGGAGGSGGGNAGTGGSGAAGQVILTWTASAADPPATHQGSQRFDSLPDLTTYEPHRQKPYAQWFEPPLPKPKQLSQRFDTLPIFDQYLQIYGKIPPPLAGTYIPDSPKTRQANQQLSYVLPDYWQHWNHIRPDPWDQFYARDNPPIRAAFANNRYELPDEQRVWWEYHIRFFVFPDPVPQDPPSTRQGNQQLSYDLPDHWPDWQMLTQLSVLPWWQPPLPASQQPSQSLYYDLPEEDFVWWEQTHYHKIPLASQVLINQSWEGTSGIYTLVLMPGWSGMSRVQNDIAGYNVYIGEDALPDLTQPPAAFSLTLPITYTLPLPSSGTPTFYVLVRRQDHYGLESQNQYYSIFTIDSAGHLILPDLTPPQNLSLFEMSGSLIRVLATYPGFGTDVYGATEWRIYSGVTLPDPSVDSPVATATISKVLAVNFGPNAVGTYFVVVGLYRLSDNKIFTVSGTVTIHTGPDEVEAVPSGWDVEP